MYYCFAYLLIFYCICLHNKFMYEHFGKYILGLGVRTDHGHADKHIDIQAFG